MAIKLQDALTAFAELKKDTSDIPSATFIRWCDYVNKLLYRNIIATDAERFTKEQSLIALSGQQTYTLPADFRDISAYQTGIYYTDNAGTTLEERVPRTDFGCQNQGFYIKGNYIYLTPIPVKTDTYVLRYTPSNTTLTSLNDYFTLDATLSGAVTIPDEYLNNLVKALDLMYAQWDEEPGAESLADARFARELDELLGTIRKEASSYGLPDFSITF